MYTLAVAALPLPLGLVLLLLLGVGLAAVLARWRALRWSWSCDDEVDRRAGVRILMLIGGKRYGHQKLCKLTWRRAGALLLLLRWVELSCRWRRHALAVY